MSHVLVYIEGQNGEIKKGSQELLTAAQKSGVQVSAVAFGSDVKSLTASLGSFGVQTLFIYENNSQEFHPELFTLLAEEAVKKSGAKILLASQNSRTRDFLPRLAAKLDAGYMSDCTQVEISGDKLTATRPMYAGKCTAKVEFSGDLQIAVVRPNQMPIATGANVQTQVVELSKPTLQSKLKLKEVTQGEAGKVDLTEANMIVSGGRGLKEAQNFSLLNDLAETLGATVGASRAVVDAGWVPHTLQVGQTGKTVAPSLYIAAGISGAIQHLAGMSGSKVIVAINKDPNAPIFQKATYGIVGDVFEVLPKLNEELKQALK